jgi:septal ring factor EnvC (AmiA/AmiB activator)
MNEASHDDRKDGPAAVASHKEVLIMRKSFPRFIGFAAIAALVLWPSGCTPKKVQLQLADQTARIEKSEERITELQKSNEALTGNLNETKAALESSRVEAKKAAEQNTVLNTQVSTLQARNVDLADSVAEAKTAADQSAKKIKTLQGQVYMLTKQKAEKEEMIAVKDNEIASLRTAQAGLKETVAAKDAQISRLNEEKASLSGEMEKTVGGKNTTILILAVLLALAVIAAVIALRRAKKPTPSL